MVGINFSWFIYHVVIVSLLIWAILIIINPSWVQTDTGEVDQSRAYGYALAISFGINFGYALIGVLAGAVGYSGLSGMAKYYMPGLSEQVRYRQPEQVSYRRPELVSEEVSSEQVSYKPEQVSDRQVSFEQHSMNGKKPYVHDSYTVPGNYRHPYSKSSTLKCPQ